MIYEYRCQCGRTAERVCRVSERNAPFICSYCQEDMIRVPSFTGGLKTEHPVWLDDSVRGSLQSKYERPITTRKEHDALCESKGVVQL